jgi:hypothetical protein
MLERVAVAETGMLWKGRSLQAVQLGIRVSMAGHSALSPEHDVNATRQSNTPGNRLFDDLAGEKADKQPPLRGNCRPLGLTNCQCPPTGPNYAGLGKVPPAGNFLPDSRRGFFPKMARFGHSAATQRCRGSWAARPAGLRSSAKAECASCRDGERLAVVVAGHESLIWSTRSSGRSL